jgi:hypothetical protein
MPEVQLHQKILWKSYKIDGKWYEGIIISITPTKKGTELQIMTGLEGIHQVVFRFNTHDDIKLITEQPKK